jgi:hypothetical protein
MRRRFQSNKTMKTMIAKRIKTERQAIRTLILLIVGYLVSWLPYAVAALLLYFGFIKTQRMSPYVTLLSALIAKLSFIWIPTFYIITNKNLRVNEMTNVKNIFTSILTCQCGRNSGPRRCENEPKRDQNCQVCCQL